MVNYIILEDKVLVIDDSYLDDNDSPIITEISIEEYNKIKGDQ
jgi:hypothetical protein